MKSETVKYPWYVRLLFWFQIRRYGSVLRSAEIWARTPKVYLALAFLYGMFERKSSPLSPALRTLVCVKVSQINGCEFCVDINSALALKRGVSEQKLRALSNYKSSFEFNDLELAVLDYTKQVTINNVTPSSEEFKKAAEYFTREGLIELTGLIGFQNMSSKFNTSLGVEPQGYCEPSRAKELSNESS